jgi:hypothetical protein
MSAGIIFVFMLFVADSAERKLPPRAWAVHPVAMEPTLQLLEREMGMARADLRIPWDSQRAARSP